MSKQKQSELMTLIDTLSKTPAGVAVLHAASAVLHQLGISAPSAVAAKPSPKPAKQAAKKSAKKATKKAAKKSK